MLMRPDIRTQQRDLLLSITRAITAQLDLGEVLRRVLHASVAMLTGRVGIIALGDRGSAQFTIRAYTGLKANSLPALNEKLGELLDPAGGAGFSREFLNRKLREMADVIDSGLAQSIAMPLVFAGDPVGLLVVFRSYQTAITPQDLGALQSFADQAAIAVNNAQLYGEINQERQRLEAIVNNSGDGVFILDSALCIQQANPAFARMTGWKTAELIGKHIRDIVVWERQDSGDLEDALEAGWASQVDGGDGVETLYVEGDLRRRDGARLSLGITYAPLLTDEQRLESIIANARDITNFRKAQEMQSTFISTVHHELRTPIAIIKGYASTLRRDDVEWEREVIRENMRIIEDEADRLTGLVEDLLTASKIQAARAWQLNPEDLRLDQLAARAVARLEGGSGHRFELSFPPAFPVIQGDETRLRQVIDNLLTNAIKYSPAGTTITVGGRYSARSVTVFVRDEGAGIADDQRDRIFERFYRIDDKLTRRAQGTGLGLHLAKAIVEAHRGEISVKSSVGGGSTFYFTLPRGPSSA